jgi:hypothetical protein
MWQFDAIFDHAVSIIDREKLDPSDLLILGLSCGVARWWKAGYKSLIQDENLLSRDNAAALGWEIAWKIATVREKWRSTSAKQATPSASPAGPSAFGQPAAGIFGSQPPPFQPFGTTSLFGASTVPSQPNAISPSTPITLDGLIDASFDSATGNPIWSEGRTRK